MKSIKGSQTEKNLLASFAGESQARNRYTFFASVAKKAGYEQIAEIFLETAENEKEHAKLFFKCLEGGEVEIKASYPAGIIADTSANLAAAAEGEHLEWTKLYKEAAEIAKKEGFDEVSKVFQNVLQVEIQHEKRYRRLLESLKGDKVFKKDSVVKWKCRVCGHIHEGNAAPDKCPVCSHGRGFFELLCENY